MNALGQHYRVLATTHKRPHSPEQFSYYSAARRIEWCEHPKSTYPKNGKQEKLPCGGDLEKCALVAESGRTT